MVVLLALAWIVSRMVGAIVQAVSKTRFGQWARTRWDNLRRPRSSDSAGETTPGEMTLEGPKIDEPESSGLRPDAPEGQRDPNDPDQEVVQHDSDEIDPGGTQHSSDAAPEYDGSSWREYVDRRNTEIRRWYKEQTSQIDKLNEHMD
jgi:hypothetical protein